MSSPQARLLARFFRFPCMDSMFSVMINFIVCMMTILLLCRHLDFAIDAVLIIHLRFCTYLYVIWVFFYTIESD